MAENINVEILQMAKHRITKDPIYVQLCRKGQEDCLAYVKKNIMRFAKDAIDRSCITELKEFESYGFIKKTNVDKLAQYAVERDNQNNEIIV